ncbi:MAG: hypothetical protein V4687_15930 [Bacteroidota bacterium]
MEEKFATGLFKQTHKNQTQEEYDKIKREYKPAFNMRDYIRKLLADLLPKK